MAGALDLWNRISNRIIHEERKPRIPIPVGDDAPPKPPIEPQKDYFGLRINQLFLHDARQWFTKIEPAVYASTEFLYGGMMRTDPFVVGPRKDEKLPPGTVMQNIGICGPHPHRGGKLTYTIVLAQMPVGNAARDLLDIVEQTGKVLDPSASLASWTKLGGVVLDGFDRLMGLSAVKPLIGMRLEHDADADGRLAPGHYALIDADNPDPRRFWVRDNVLVHGLAQAAAAPYRETDFVLYEITRSEGGRRTDVDKLPFQALWDKVQDAVGRRGPDAWDEAKGNFAALATALYRSPDLTRDQASALRDQYEAIMVARHAETKRLETLSGIPAGQLPATPRLGDILRLD